MQMLGLVFRIATPAVLSNMMAVVTVITNTMIAGRMNDPTKLAAVGLANVCFGIMMLSVMSGLNSAQETLTSQAYGFGDLKLCGIYLNRGRAVLMVFFVPLVVLPAFFAEQILVAIGQDPEVSALAHRQILAGIPAIFCFG